MVTKTTATPRPLTTAELALARVRAALWAAGASPADLAWLDDIYRKAAALTRMARGG